MMHDSQLCPAAAVLGCDLQGELGLLCGVDAFNALSRRKEKAVGAYIGPIGDGKMIVVGLGHGGDDPANVKASFGTPTQAFKDSGGCDGYDSLFGQLQELVDNPVMVVDLPGDVDEPFQNRRIFTALKLCFMFDQPALIGFLGLGKGICAFVLGLAFAGLHHWLQLG